MGARGPRARGVGGAGRRWEPAADEAGREVGGGCEVEEQMIRWRGKGRGCRGHFTLFCILTLHEVVLSNIFSKQLLLRLHQKTAPTEPEPYKHAVSEGPTSYKLAIFLLLYIFYHFVKNNLHIDTMFRSDELKEFQFSEQHIFLKKIIIVSYDLEWNYKFVVSLFVIRKSSWSNNQHNL